MIGVLIHQQRPYKNNIPQILYHINTKVKGEKYGVKKILRYPYK
jgi:hypothetical protein